MAHLVTPTLIVGRHLQMRILGLTPVRHVVMEMVDQLV